MNYNQGGQPAAESQQIRSESSDETVAKSSEGEKRERSKEKGERKKPKSAESGAQCGGSYGGTLTLGALGALGARYGQRLSFD